MVFKSRTQFKAELQLDDKKITLFNDRIMLSKLINRSCNMFIVFGKNDILLQKGVI